jgi:hypothetical protein
MGRPPAWLSRVLLVVLSPLILLFVVLALVVLIIFWAYGLLLRLAVELSWGRVGRRVLLVYSNSPHWQKYIESKWLPRLEPYAIVLNWSERSRWWKESRFAARVFRHFSPSQGFNPTAVLFPRLGRTRRVSFYQAFRDFKHGKEAKLREAEETLFAFIAALEQSDRGFKSTSG